MTTIVTLGGMTLESFEVPATISFGGSQRMAVHDLPGGGRVIDVLGAVSADITFAGIISGSDAETRVSLIDTMRISGAALVLGWDAQYCTVILREAVFDYEKPWWIPYRLRCIVQNTAVFAAAIASAAASITADLAAAAGVLGGLPISLDAANAALAVTGATTFGTAAYAQSVVALTSAQAAVSTSLTSIGAPLSGLGLGLGGNDTSAMVAAMTAATTTAGSLAALASAQGSIGSACSDLQTIGA
jgi:hypothetical protein